MIDEFKNSPLASGADGIYYPGEKELIAYRKCKDGSLVAVDGKTLEIIYK